MLIDVCVVLIAIGFVLRMFEFTVRTISRIRQGFLRG